MKKLLLKIMSIFISANIALLNATISANPTIAYEARQKMISILNKEQNNENLEYKYLTEQLCIFFNLPRFPNEELTFNTPFGVARIEIKSTRSVFITNGINEYDKMGKTLDDILTKNGRKRLAKIILEYLQTAPDKDYKTKTFDAYTFENYGNFFDLENEKSKFYFNLYSNSSSYIEDCNKLRSLNQKIKELEDIGSLDLRSNKDKKKQVMKARGKVRRLIGERDRLKNKISDSRNSDIKKLKNARNAANALCAILMAAEPNYNRSFDGGKHERALMRSIRYSGETYTEAFEKFIPSKKNGGADLAHDYSTNPNGSKEILESDYYSDDEYDEVSYDLDNLPTN